MKQYLSKFKTIEDFRVLEPQINEMVGNLPNISDRRRYRSVSESDGFNVTTSVATSASAASASRTRKNDRDERDYMKNRKR